MAPLAALAAPVTLEFQQGLNDYAGTVDLRLRARDTVKGVETGTYSVDGGKDGYGFGDPDYSVLYLMFNDVFGDAPGQVPYGSMILQASVELTTNVASDAQTGNAFTLAPLIEPLRLPEEGSTATIYTLYSYQNVPRGPNFPDGATLRPGNGFQSVLTPNVQDQGEKSYNDVTEILRYWSNTTREAPLNNGFVMNDANSTDAWSFASTGNGVIENRPKLSVTYFTPQEAAVRLTTTTLFRQGEFNEGQGTAYEDCVSVFLPDTVNPVRAPNFAALAARQPMDGSTITAGQFLDGIDATSVSPDDQLNIQFKNLFGDQPGRIAVRPNLKIERAMLRLVTGPSGNAYSPGPVDVRPFLKPWYTEDESGIRTFKKFTEFTTPDAPTGTVGLGPSEATGDLGPIDDTYYAMGFNMIVEADVSASIKAWAAGQPNYGWNVQMETGDGWQLFFPGANNPDLRPQLLITYSYDPDKDGDGLPDEWETANETNPDLADADADPDADGLTNKQEYELGTKPKLKDTDADGYDDKAETGTGIWAGVTETGTNPLVADTDGDGLADGLENPSLPYTGATQPGTDPNKSDSDGDGFIDPSELAFETNPASATSVPSPEYTPVLSENFDSQSLNSAPQFTTSQGTFVAGSFDSLVPAHLNTAQITDGSVNSNSSIAWDYVAAKGKAIRLTFDYRLSADVNGAEAADGFGIGLYRTSVWDVAGPANPGFTPKAWEDPRSGGGFNDALHFSFDTYNGATEGNNIRVAGPVDPTKLLINKVAPFQLNNGLFNRVIITGVTMGSSSVFNMDVVTDVDGAAPLTNSIFKNLMVPGFDVTKEEFRIMAGARSGTAVVKSELDNISLAVAGTSVTPPAGLPAFSISGLVRTENPAGLTVTWDSVAAGVYTVERSETMTGVWAPVGNPVTATGNTSSVTDILPATPPDTLFYRVRRTQ